jgi:hypothetical protein
VSFDVIDDLLESMFREAVVSEELRCRLPLEVESVGVLGLFPLGHEANFFFVLSGG